MDSLEFTSVGFGDLVFPIPGGSQRYEHTERITLNGTEFDVNIEVSVDYAAREVKARFDSIMPDSGLPPPVDIGFLPPENGTGRGMGHIGYVIDPNPALSTGTEIRNIGFITFDRLAGGPTFRTDLSDLHDPESPPDPNRQALVTIDADPAISAVDEQTETHFQEFVPISWTGEDVGAGIANYDIYVKEGDGDWTLWLNNATGTSGIFFADSRNTYSFYSVANDGAGFSEPNPDEDTLADTAFEVIPIKMVLLKDLEVRENESTVTYHFTLNKGDPGSQWRIDKSTTLKSEWLLIDTVTLDADGGGEFQDIIESTNKVFYRAVFVVPDAI
jgi:hypothetical protein